MAKRFKLRISRVFTSLQSCRSKDPSYLPEDPVPSFLKPSPELITVDFPITTIPSKTQPHRPSFKRHVSTALISIGCGFTSKPGTVQTSGDGRTRSQEFKWQREEKWHVVAKIYEETPRRKIYNSSASGYSDNDRDDDAFAVPPPRLPRPSSTGEKKRRRAKKKKKSAQRLRTSTSSADSEWFSSECGNYRRGELEETETLVSSSRSFSTDSSLEFNPQLKTITESPATRPRQKVRSKKQTAKKPSKRSAGKIRTATSAGRRSSVSSEGDTPARLSVFQKLIPCTVDGKVKESFAIVKRSVDPYEDFKRSMMEMIVEKQMFEKEDLEQLLQCFLSLNSRHYHGVIVQAFSEIWEALFIGKVERNRTPTGRRPVRSRRPMTRA